MKTWLHVNHVNSHNFFIIVIQKPMTAVKQSHVGLQFSYQLHVRKQSKALSSAHTHADVMANPQSMFVLAHSTCPQYLWF
jgi:hypothetical protein